MAAALGGHTARLVYADLGGSSGAAAERLVFVYTKAGLDESRKVVYQRQHRHLGCIDVAVAAGGRLVAHLYLKDEAMRLLTFRVGCLISHTHGQWGTVVLIEPHAPRSCIRTGT